VFRAPGYPRENVSAGVTLRRPIAVFPSQLVHTIPSSPQIPSFSMAYSGSRPSIASVELEKLFAEVVFGMGKIVEIQAGRLPAFFPYGPIPCSLFHTVLLSSSQLFNTPYTSNLSSLHETYPTPLTWRLDLSLPVHRPTRWPHTPHILPLFLIPVPYPQCRLLVTVAFAGGRSIRSQFPLPFLFPYCVLYPI